MRLSVVIPTHNRREILARTLRALEGEEPRGAWEVVVADDGSTDGTRDLLRDSAATAPFPLTATSIPKSSQARALNEALRLARAPLALILGDDILAGPGLLSAHLAAHERLRDPRVAVLGRVEWHPEVAGEPFRAWLEKEGILWAYRRLLPETFVPARFFYTNNVSLDREWALAIGGFRDNLPAWPDTEFAFRAERRGLRVFYHPAAAGFHLDAWDISRVLARGRLKGRLAADLVREDPGFGRFVTLPRPGAWRSLRRAAARALRPLGEALRLAALSRWYWIHEIQGAFADGFREGRRGGAG